MIRLTTALAATGAAILTVPAGAQDHSMHDMPGMSSSPEQPEPKAEEPRSPPEQQHAGHDMEGMDPGSADEPVPQDEHAGHDTSGTPASQASGTALPAGDAPAPRPPMDHYADRRFAPDDMARARRSMMHEEGGRTFYQLMFNLAEYRAVQGRDGYRWDAEAWVGGDVHRLTVKTEGEGIFRQGMDDAEVQALYSRAIGPYFNLQAGVRHDFGEGPDRTYAVVGFEGLAPYWFEVEGAVFLSDKGDLLARLEGYYDQRLTQRLVVQPRVELGFAAADIPESRIGAGMSDAELGLRLRYEISRRFAPYLGVSYQAKIGQTARYARADGRDSSSTALVTGLRLWF